MSETVALNKKRQSKFAKKTAKVKSKVQKGEITLNDDAAAPSPKKAGPDRGLIYVGHIPHGFYEKEMRSYFGQFGKITKVRVCRSFKSGNSKGFGYVQFLLPEVAEIAAQTMDNYLMFKRRLEVKNIPPENQKHDVFKGANWTHKHTPYKAANNRATRQRNSNDDDEKHIKKAQQQLKRLQKNMKKLNKLGIVHEFKPKDVPEGLTLKTPLKDVKKAKKVVKSKLGKLKKPAPKTTGMKPELDTSPKIVQNKQKSLKVSVKSLKGKKIVDKPKTKLDASPKVVQSKQKAVKVSVKSLKGKQIVDKLPKKNAPKKMALKKKTSPKTTVDAWETEEVPKTKKIMQKNLAIAKPKKAPVKKMSDKLKKATMGILNSDLVVKTGKIQKKKVIKKK